jgi:acetate kinase
MNILVFNAGSASLKFDVIAVQSATATPDSSNKLVSGIIEDIGNRAALTLTKSKQVLYKDEIVCADFGDATRQIIARLDAARITDIPKVKRLDAVGHRIVHGGDRFTAPIRINEEVLAAIDDLEDLAPLHNTRSVRAVRAAQEILGTDMPMVAVFDTSFHRTIPQYIVTYPLPLGLARRHRIRRYGFHGISHEYLAGRYAKITNKPLESVNLITLHLESGCSACAVHSGQSLDTSMGFTPLEGLMMGMRSGDIDPSIIGYLMRHEQVGIEQVEEWLNKESGLLGVSGRSHDTRELVKLIDRDENVRLAMEMFCYRISKYIGAYLAALNGAEAVIFGGGIGEDTPFVRTLVCGALEWCGLTLDPERNAQTINREGRISTDDSRLHAWVIPVEEGLMIAQQVAQCLGSE